ncbi:MAG: serine protease [Rhodospirillaceae bacterium]|nr:serine protease [Rhodospirillaceae bacterium]HAA93808.1 serine protease [Rhodospirillaceae bacterium]
MRLPPGLSFIVAALVWTVGGLLFDREGVPRQRGPATESRPPPTQQFIPAPSQRGRGRTLPEISRFDPEIPVKWDSGRGGNATGTAFPVSSKGIWLTARHVVDGCAKVGLFSDPKARKGFWVSGVDVHPNADIAVLRTRRAPPAIAVRSLSEKLKIGQDGFHFGYPMGKPGDLTTQLIGRRKLRKVGGRSFVEPAIAWAVTHQTPRLDRLGGISGGPVLDGQGRVIGVTVAGNIRRGRVIASAPGTIHQTLRNAGVRLDGRPSAGVSGTSLNPRGYPAHGSRLRGQLSVAKVFCKGKS